MVNYARGLIFLPFFQSCLVAVASDGTLSVFSAQDRYVLLRVRTGSGGHSGTRVHAISWRLPEMMMLVLSEQGTLGIWDLVSGQLER